MLDDATRTKLVFAITAYDRKESQKTHHNPNMLGIALGHIETRIAADMAEGSTLAQALYDNFNDRLLTALEKSVGLPVTYGGGKHAAPRPTY